MPIKWETAVTVKGEYLDLVQIYSQSLMGLLLLPHPETEDPCLSLEEILREPVKLHINIASEPVTHDVRRMDGL